jgi:uncharacterized integral membrane protein
VEEDVYITPEPKPWRPSARQVFIWVVVVLLLVFAFVNLEEVKVDLVFTQVMVPVFFVIAVPALLGFLVGMIFQRQKDKDRRRR